MVGSAPTASAFFLMLVCANVAGIGYANNFLRVKVSAVESERVSEESVRASLLEEAEGVLGHGSTARRVARLEAALSPMYVALPKNEYGNLGNATVRYALHRLFVQRYAWYVKGLEPDGSAMNSSSPTGVLKDHLPSYVEGLFESRLHGHGFSLHDTAVFAATLEHLIHDHAVRRAEKAYSAAEFSRNETLLEMQVDKVLHEYMKLYIFGDNFARSSDAQISDLYPGWENTKSFVRSRTSLFTRGHFAQREPGHTNLSESQAMDFTAMTRLIEDVSEHYGMFQNADCTTMKNDLLKYADHDTGRVKLASFYQASLDHGSTQFSESKEYLRELGALDESNANDPRVIVPNYINSPGNCLASYGIYSVCCINECESLMASLERSIESPVAKPDEIAELAAALHSATVHAPRNLSAPLLYRLNEIAEAHGGTVPLHGRLFAQWMHHAFPRECPYPHESGTTNPQTPSEWMEENDEDHPTLSREEMRRLVEDASMVADAPSQGALEEAMPWSSTEELLAVQHGKILSAATTDTTAWSRLRGVALVAAVTSGLLGPAYAFFHAAGISATNEKKCLGKFV